MAEPNGNTLLLADGDDLFRGSLAGHLTMSGDFAVTEAPSGCRALDLALCASFSAIILDARMPDAEGHELCRHLRRAGVRVPIILLATAPSDADVVLGLDYGANDCLSKAVSFGVLLARLRAHMRQYARCHGAEVAIGRYTFRPASKLLIDREQRAKIRLTYKEAAILSYLYDRRSHVVSREVLLREVWGYRSGVMTHTVESHVYRLRQKTRTGPSNDELILTGHGGYRLAS